MTIQEIVAAIPTLSFDERVGLLKVLTHSLHNAERRNNQRGVSASDLRGVLKVGSPPPGDEEVKEAYTEYLMERYK